VERKVPFDLLVYTSGEVMDRLKINDFFIKEILERGGDMKNETEEITCEWLQKADSDLAFARASFEDFDDFYGQICILCHDDAEKYLKAFIALYGLKPEYIHDLLRLLNQCCDFSQELAGLQGTCITLNPYYTPLKYPSHYPTPNRDQAKEAVEVAIQISRIIRDKCK